MRLAAMSVAIIIGVGGCSSPATDRARDPGPTRSALPPPTADQGCDADAIRRDAGSLAEAGTKTQRVVAVTFAISSVADRILGELDKHGPWSGGDDCLRALGYFAEVVDDDDLKADVDAALEQHYGE